MTKKHIYQIIIAIIAIGAFGSMGWVGYQLIQKVSEGASHIHSQIKQPEPAPVNSPVLIPIEPIISDSLGNNEPLSEVISVILVMITVHFLFVYTYKITAEPPFHRLV